MKPRAKTASLNTEDLRFFLAVRQARSIKGGARVLRVDHSTVSRRLASLEEALDARLFERTPEGLIETDVAVAIAPLAERIEAITSELEDAANAAAGVPSGPLRIAVSPVVAEHFLIPRLPDLMKRFPGITFDIHADISRRSLSKREADIAIRQHAEGRRPPSHRRSRRRSRSSRRRPTRARSTSSVSVVLHVRCGASPGTG